MNEVDQKHRMQPRSRTPRQARDVRGWGEGRPKSFWGQTNVDSDRGDVGKCTQPSSWSHTVTPAVDSNPTRPRHAKHATVGVTEPATSGPTPTCPWLLPRVHLHISSRPELPSTGPEQVPSPTRRLAGPGASRSVTEAAWARVTGTKLP